MEELKIDITTTPPTPEQIAQWHETAHQQKARAEATERRIGRWGLGVAIVCLLALAALWSSGLITGTAAGAAAVDAAVAAAMAAAMAAAGTAAMAAAVAAAVAVTAAVAAAVAAAGAAAMAVVGAMAAADAAAAAGAGAVAVAVLGLAVYEKWVITPRERAEAILDALTELDPDPDNPDKHTDECLAYAEWCETDETVRRYQSQVAAQGRNPIMAEYEAARAWIADAEERRSEAEKAEQARLACERLRSAGLSKEELGEKGDDYGFN